MSLTGTDAAECFLRFQSLISNESDRGAVLVSAALIDDGLKQLIVKKLVSSGSKVDRLFDGGNAPLGTFSARIEMAYRLGLIQQSTKELLNIFRKIRNEFAHHYDEVSFNDVRVRQRLKSLFSKHDDIMTALMETAKSCCADVMGEKVDSPAVDDFFESNWPLRATFDLFFAMTSMALHRIEADVERLIPLTSSDDPEAIM